MGEGGVRQRVLVGEVVFVVDGGEVAAVGGGGGLG